MTNMAMNYGANIGKQAMNQAEGIVEKYIPVGQLKVGNKALTLYNC